MRQDELVAAHVRALIKHRQRVGELKPGDKLPFTQAELAEQLRVNKNSVFWGLAALRADGVIVGVQGGRAVVARWLNDDEASPTDSDAEDTEPL